MIEDMTIRQFTPSTQHTYVRFVKDFSIFFGRSPDKAAFEDVRLYQLHLASHGVSPCTMNGAMTALRFFFRVTLQRFDIANHIPLVPQPQRLPVVLSPEEVARLLEAARGPKYKAALAVAYGAGLRVSEIVSLKVSDIDSKRMVIQKDLVLPYDKMAISRRYIDGVAELIFVLTKRDRHSRRWENPQRRQARRPPGPAEHQGGACDQPQDSQGARPHC